MPSRRTDAAYVADEFLTINGELAPPIPPHLQSRHPILQGPIAWSMPGASPHSSVDTYRASPVAAVLTLSGGADDIRRALPDVRSAPAVGDADGGGGDDDGGGPSGAESANSSNDATEVPPSSGMKRTASRDVAAILLSLSPPAQASPLIGPLTTAPHAIPSVELSHTTSLSSCVSLLGTPTGQSLRDWAAAHGRVLLWSLGPLANATCGPVP